MKISSLTSLCLSIPGLKNCVSGSTNDVQPTQAPGIDTLPGFTDPSNPYYLEYHDYQVEYHYTGYVTVFSNRLDQSMGRRALRMHIGGEHKVATLYDNNLHHEKSDDRSLELPQVFQSLCLWQNVKSKDIEWVVIDVDEISTSQMLKDYRKRHLLNPKDEIKVVPSNNDWALFAKTRNYKDAIRMVPDSTIDRILVKRQDREVRNGEFPVVIAEVMMFSYKKPSKKKKVTTDLVDAHAAELASEEVVDAAMKAANEAMKIDMMELLETSPDAFSKTTSGEGADLENASGSSSQPVPDSSYRSK
ncbi:hypothetical protein HOO65_050005 [Ceratocystis lukuohia]|uniref:Uncharacterized protein n=1 Tax=Ceratocystis lukuohia TaxID=2019550 RepID=A0ABR4MF35_9PEZI